MIAKKDIFATMLRDNGHSLTKSRQAVFTILSDGDPLTMSELVKLCGSIDRASVYRSVELFEKIGVAHRLYTGWKYRIELTEIFDHHHHHATCTNCGMNVVLEEDPSFETAIQNLADQYQFNVTSHQVELSGLCEACRKK